MTPPNFIYIFVSVIIRAINTWRASAIAISHLSEIDDDKIWLSFLLRGRRGLSHGRLRFIFMAITEKIRFSSKKKMTRNWFWLFLFWERANRVTAGCRAGCRACARGRKEGHGKKLRLRRREPIIIIITSLPKSSILNLAIIETKFIWRDRNPTSLPKIKGNKYFVFRTSGSQPAGAEGEGKASLAC